MPIFNFRKFVEKEPSCYFPSALLVVILFFLQGCSPAVHQAATSVPAPHTPMAKTEATHYHRYQRPKPLVPVSKETETGMGDLPTFKRLSPLETQLVSLSFVNEDYHAILQSLAHASGLNLVIDPQVPRLLGQQGTLTAEFHSRPVKEILDSVCQILNIHWHQSHGTIYIEPFAQKIFDLDFLSTVQGSKFKVGGDVLGGSSTGQQEVLTPLSGSFEIGGEVEASVTDIYDNLEEQIIDRIGDEGSIYLNRQTGTLAVRTRPRTLEEIENYITALKEKYSRQVLIEARILEVELNKAHELGIDWGRLQATISQDQMRQGGALFNLRTDLTENGLLYGLRLSHRYYDISAVFRALEEFGHVRSLSNPRLKAMNGQSAMISVGRSVSYLRSLETEQTAGEGLSTTNVSVEISSIFDGVLLGVTPIIEKNNSVSLHLLPIKSDLIALREREFEGGNRYTFPVVNLREASTVIRTKSGEMFILGGLIQERSEDTESGLPVLQKMPLVGGAFKHSVKKSKRVELVIIMSVKVLGNEQTV